MPTQRRNWARDELVVAFNLYCRMPFGQIRHQNPVIVQLAQSIGRTPSALSMKMGNFARLDPAHQRRNVGGLSHGGKLDRQVWDEFHANWETLALESQLALQRLDAGVNGDQELEAPVLPGDKPSEITRQVKVRLVQRFFRDSVLSSYDYACTICELRLRKMLNASHIIPWSVDAARRADPRNGLSLCAFHDRAFDRGLITLDEHLRVTVSEQARIEDPPKLHHVGLLEIENRPIRLPERFHPDAEALAYHRENIFLDAG
ncbi:MAG: HNH endonuclease [Phycisphaerae bacterium]|nr:HNH endonuclease [Planctomycetota bacterium]MBL7219001.1 HNH endonuclease [Phycisphaerae bacterium]